MGDVYNEALSSGRYQKPSGLLGKYDNVRRFWEDQELGLYLRPYLEELVDARKKEGKQLRVLDLGCGGGDGLEMITAINRTNPPLAQHDARIIQPDTLELYHGVDMNEGLLAQARSIYGRRPNLAFFQADFNKCDLIDEQAYDLYLANYGTLSHNDDDQTVALLGRIARSARKGAVVIVDWLGRFSYEWQTLWTKDLAANEWMDYVISYIYAGDDKPKKQNLSHFPLRIMGRREADRIYDRVSKDTGGAISRLKLADRSSYVGRHIDTGDYNPHCQPLRRLVNSLFEPNVGTDLAKLVISYVPQEGFDEVNAYYEKLTRYWNYLVLYTQALLEATAPPEAPTRMPLAVRQAVSTMSKTVKLAASMKLGNPRPDWVEPQLGYCLRETEMALQEGLGCGHGLVSVFKIK